MRELGFLFKPSPYNSMLSLYIQLEKLNMVDKLLNEMEENKVKPDNLTANNVLRAVELCLKKSNNDKQVFELERDTVNAMTKAYARAWSEVKATCKKVMLLWATLILLISLFLRFLYRL
ncbi:unnamed protein product [Arabis nemorensis]|uniref:Uncharacterized protein n=1 Tax=Arabis nemorensis TaxID=586526 RepID=A0A565AMF3_9BRAS|nr:unnamed protein product [Arabis nemorensis]